MRIWLIAALLLASCGGATIDEDALRSQIRDEVLEDLRTDQARRNESTHREAQPPVALPDVERFAVETAHAPHRGASDPLVTIVEFSDFQCPFCGRVNATLARVLEEFPDEVQIVFRNNPLPFHQGAIPAAEAALEAYDQGGDALFWRMHDLLFENSRALERSDLEGYAAQLGMNPSLLRDALDQQRHRPRIQADQQATTALGARGTPAFFINGRQLMGAQPFDRFAEIIREEIQTARMLMGHGVQRNAIYARLMEGALTEPGPEDPSPPSPSPSPSPRPQPDPQAVYRVPVTGRPQLGPDDALITIVEYSEFQCPFCSRVQPALEQIRQRYGNDVRFVYRHNPLPFHQNAMPAAEAAEEVFSQLGSQAFFRYGEQLFANQRSLDEAMLIQLAVQAGASGPRVRSALADHRHRATIEADQQLARSLGASGTPSFFINGRSLRGAQPFSAFEALIDELLPVARARVAAGTPRNQLYDGITGQGATTPQMIPGVAPTPAAPPPGADTVYTIPEPSRAPSRGPRSAQVTIQIFSDFQCPFCNRVRPTLDQIVSHYDQQVRLVWRDYPLPFHDHAMLAAEAAREVFVQGGNRAFWQYNDLLFANQRNLTEAELVRLASGIPGVRGRRVQRALSAHTHRAGVEADMEAVQNAGARIGTPSFFVNGRLVQGAQPFAAFQVAIDRALAEAP